MGADDIFDKAASSSGDIFDQAAAAQPQIPDATAQAHAMFQPGGKLYPGKLPPERTYDYGAALGGLPSPGRTVSGEEGQQIHEQAKQGLKTGIEMGGGMLGGAAVEGPGVIAGLLRMAGAGAGAATGNVVGSAATGQTPNPNEALKTGATYAAAEGAGIVGGKALGAAGKLIGKLSGKAPEEIAELKNLIPREDAIQQKVLQGRNFARTSASLKYPEINTPVDVSPAQDVAQQVSQQMVAHNAPSQVSRVANLPGAAQLSTGPGLVTEEVAQLLQKLNGSNLKSFTDAQQLYSALGEALSRGRGQMPGEVYSALQATRSTLGDQMGAAAKAEGKFEQFQAAQKSWSQYMQDWFNPGAPMRQITAAASNKDFAVLKKLVGDDGGRIVKTMERYGIDASDVKALQQMGKKGLLGKISDAAELNRMGEEGFQKQAANQARAATLKNAAKMVVGGGTLYELSRLAGAAGKGPQ